MQLLRKVTYRRATAGSGVGGGGQAASPAPSGGELLQALLRSRASATRKGQLEALRQVHSLHPRMPHSQPLGGNK